MTIGKRIKQCREQTDMTLEEAAKHIGVTRQTLSRYETGVIGNIPYDKIVAIAKAYHTTPAHIMGWEEKDGSKPAPVPVLSPNRRALLELAETATDEQISMLLRLAKAVLAEQEK